MWGQIIYVLRRSFFFFYEIWDRIAINAIIMIFFVLRRSDERCRGDSTLESFFFVAIDVAKNSFDRRHSSLARACRLVFRLSTSVVCAGLLDVQK